MVSTIRSIKNGTTSASKDGFASYDLVASEYYDRSAHPTCFNFNRLSRLYITERFPEPWEKTPVIEVGAGDSAIAPLLHSRGYSLDSVTITDASPAMLAHSHGWRDKGASTMVCPAQELSADDESYATVVSSLGDPYNTPHFWREANRVLTLGGKLIFTTPSFEWSHRFRRPVAGYSAEFVVSGGDSLDLPSFILPMTAQLEMMEAAGFSLVHFASLGINRLHPLESVSPKLTAFDECKFSVIWGFELVKRLRLLR